MGTTEDSDLPTDSQGVCPLGGTPVFGHLYGTALEAWETLLSSVLPDCLLLSLLPSFSPPSCASGSPGTGQFTGCPLGVHTPPGSVPGGYLNSSS